jgi:3-hydroxyisobutyrate dehydrogenase-like beta-hydroxyacid dehydrogenase
MKTIGFIGLGTMGMPMAANLLEKGYQVLVYNRTQQKSLELAENGAEVVDSPKDAARLSEVLITMLSDGQALEEVYYGDQGVLQGLHPRLTVIDCSTVSPETSKRIYHDLSVSAVDFLDAPVTGSKPAAIDGTLVFMVGGLQEVMDEHMDIFDTLGKTTLHMGPSGSGSQTKLAHNTMVGIHAAALSEGMSIAAKSGIDVGKFLSIVKLGAANSRQAELKGDKMLSRDFSNQFSLKLMSKDLNLSSQFTEQLELSLPLLRAARERFQSGMDHGWGDLDLAAIIQCYEEEMSMRVNGTKIDKTAEKTGRERRRSTRVPINIKLHLSVHQWEQEGSFKGQDIEGTLYDLSNNGLQIVSKVPLAQDMFIVIHFPKDAELPPITGRIIRIEQREAHKDTFHYGCLLSGTAPYIRAKLEEYIDKHISMV